MNPLRFLRKPKPSPAATLGLLGNEAKDWRAAMTARLRRAVASSNITPIAPRDVVVKGVRRGQVA